MPYHFYNTINQLRQNEELILYDRVLHFLDEDEQLVKEFLKIEFEIESQNYPFTPPAYNETAALWGAKLIYTTCQLILYRENKEAELPLLLPVYNNEIDAALFIVVLNLWIEISIRTTSHIISEGYFASLPVVIKLKRFVSRSH